MYLMPNGNMYMVFSQWAFTVIAIHPSVQLKVNRNFMVMADKISIPKKSRPVHALRKNRPDELTLERYKLRELAEG